MAIAIVTNIDIKFVAFNRKWRKIFIKIILSVLFSNKILLKKCTAFDTPILMISLPELQIGYTQNNGVVF